MGRRRILTGLVAIVLAIAGADGAQAHAFRARIGHAWGIVAASPTEIATGVREPAVFHGGVVMHGATLHTVFWAPAGTAFGGAPSAGVPGYEPFLQRFLGDVAATPGGVFSVLSQYGDGQGPGTDQIHYSAPADSIDDASPYPPLAQQCVSPGGAVTCVTDLQVERELDRVIAAHHGARGLHDVWLMMLPGSVDECISPGECGTSVFAGYHSLFDLGHGPTVYAVIVDPAIEQPPAPGTDPEGNPDAEHAADTTAHEVVEAVSDPQGTGWMDPDGGEVGDKCETSYGTPLGYAANGSPYDQVLNGRPYLVQLMWSNAARGCVASAPGAPAPALARVSLDQFSPVLSGRIGAAGVAVEGLLLRGATPVARFDTRSDASGRWRATLRLFGSGAPTAVGDDRDLLEVAYGPGGPAPDLIAADGGGNPFNQSGWTSWFDLDHGYAVAGRSVSIAPCSQTGVLTLRIGGRAVGSPVTACQTETDAAVVQTGSLRARTGLSLTSTDNRAAWPRNPFGALVSLTVALGEPGSVAAVGNGQILLSPTGFPACAADLRAQRVRCSGLVTGSRYTLGGLRAVADAGGDATFALSAARAWVRGGEVLVLRNRAGRRLSALHVARLRVALRGAGTAVAGGRCEPGAYLGAPVSAPETSAGVGAPSVAGSGQVCPLSGHLAGGPFVQSDPFSGGLTRTEVPVLAVTSPTPGETVYGPFIAFAQPSPAFGARVTLTVATRGSGRILRRYRGLERRDGVSVAALPRGVYVATWTVTDLNGDTRRTTSLFAEES